MIMQDDRTPEQKKTHKLMWGGNDRFMSGWGKAREGKSYAFWACKMEDSNKVESWVRRRGDILRIRDVIANGYRPSGRGHCHIYVVDENHPAIA